MGCRSPKEKGQFWGLSRFSPPKEKHWKPLCDVRKTAEPILMPLEADSCEPKEPCIRCGRDLH